MRKFLSKFLIFSGVCLFAFGGYLVWERNSPRRVSFNSPPPEQKGSLIEGINSAGVAPKIIKIPSIGKELEIFPAKINNGYWESTKKGVSYLITSPVPGEVGNSIIYGHNYPNLLKDLTKVKVGDEIKIVYDGGAEKSFEVFFTQVVGPNQSSILNPTEDRRITLYTCSGFFDSKRFVATAILK
ncbi:MAG: Sortase family protein [Candidatus Woesebacteria bacterium GW2011_GWA1_39_21]|uniref:Sortase family protein n=1 Tax=Candidatus Woesebacteria bacterium GW2011_GWA1_39_21 TaxID=1618550 RepID=A0A0G0NF02_9BACT|nr:MAG: Sortase family protein [Candidatus Woesebacteria bacterium GW2011_GWA1_39_21]